MLSVFEKIIQIGDKLIMGNKGEYKSKLSAFLWLLLIPGMIVIDAILTSVLFIRLPSTLYTLLVLFLVLATVVVSIASIVLAIVSLVRIIKHNKVVSSEHREIRKKEEEALQEALRAPGADIQAVCGWPGLREDFHKMDVRNMDFSNDRTHFKHIDFRGMNLQGVRFYGTDLSHSNFSGMDLRGVIFENANLEHVDLSGANLEGVCFRGVRLHHTNFEKANLRNADLQRADLHDSKFTGANLANANFVGTSAIWDAKFDGANMENANLEGTELLRSKFDKANMRFANLSRTKCTWSTFDEAILYGANLERAKLEYASFAGADLRMANAKKCRMDDTTRLEGVDTEGAKFISVDCSSVFPYEQDYIRKHIYGVTFKD